MVRNIYDNWELLKSFVSGMVEILDIGENRVRVGLVNFSNTITSVFHLNTTYDKTEIKAMVEDIHLVA